MRRPAHRPQPAAAGIGGDFDGFEAGFDETALVFHGRQHRCPEWRHGYARDSSQPAIAIGFRDQHDRPAWAEYPPDLSQAPDNVRPVVVSFDGGYQIELAGRAGQVIDRRLMDLEPAAFDERRIVCARFGNASSGVVHSNEPGGGHGRGKLGQPCGRRRSQHQEWRAGRRAARH